MDAIFSSFLEQQEAEARALSSESDLLDVVFVGSRPYQHFLLRFTCRGLVATKRGVAEAELFEIGVYMPLDFHARANPAEVLTLLKPVNCMHPNILAPFICPGRLTPGMSLNDIILQCFDILTFKKITMREDDALNKTACAWARRNQHRFPVDDRPLIPRRAKLRIRRPGAGEEVGR